MRIVTGGLMLISGACLAFGIIHFRLWLTERARRDYLSFAVVCFSFAIFAWFERSILLSETPAESLFYTKWSQFPGRSRLSQPPGSPILICTDGAGCSGHFAPRDFWF